MTLADLLKQRFTKYRQAVSESNTDRQLRKAKEREEASRLYLSDRERVLRGEPMQTVPFDYRPDGPSAA